MVLNYWEFWIIGVWIIEVLLYETTLSLLGTQTSNSWSEAHKTEYVAC